MQRITTTSARLWPILIALAIVATACGSDADPEDVDGGAADATAEAEDADETADDDEARDETADGNEARDETADADEAEDSAPSTTATTAPATTATSETTATSATAVTTSTTNGGLIDIRPVPIFSATAVGARALDVTVEGGVEPCFIIERVDRAESGAEVELTVFAGSEPGAVCIQIVELHTVTVDLVDPLGNRRLIDGTTGLAVEVSP